VGYFVWVRAGFFALILAGSVVFGAAEAISAPSGLSITGAPSTPSGCSPHTNKGNCYEPGEFCRNGDHGASGVAGDGESIVCANNDGWRWEPAS
jgi:hypothetical protein